MKIARAVLTVGVLLGLTACPSHDRGATDDAEAILTPITTLSYDDYRAQIPSSWWCGDAEGAHGQRYVGTDTRFCS